MMPCASLKQGNADICFVCSLFYPSSFVTRVCKGFENEKKKFFSDYEEKHVQCQECGKVRNLSRGKQKVPVVLRRIKPVKVLCISFLIL